MAYVQLGRLGSWAPLKNSTGDLNVPPLQGLLGKALKAYRGLPSCCKLQSHCSMFTQTHLSDSFVGLEFFLSLLSLGPLEVGPWFTEPPEPPIAIVHCLPLSIDPYKIPVMMVRRGLVLRKNSTRLQSLFFSRASRTRVATEVVTFLSVRDKIIFFCPRPN